MQYFLNEENFSLFGKYWIKREEFYMSIAKINTSKAMTNITDTAKYLSKAKEQLYEAKRYVGSSALDLNETGNMLPKWIDELIKEMDECYDTLTNTTYKITTVTSKINAYIDEENAKELAAAKQADSATTSVATF